MFSCRFSVRPSLLRSQFVVILYFPSDVIEYKRGNLVARRFSLDSTSGESLGYFKTLNKFNVCKAEAQFYNKRV